MISFLRRFFLDHWHRKLISVLLALIVWFVIHRSLTVSTTLPGIPVRVTHLPPGKTIEGMLGNGLLETKINLHVNGHKESLEELSAKNLEVVIDASNQPDQWIAGISKKNLFCSNETIDLDKVIVRVTPQEMIIKQSKLITEKVPILVMQPLGEAPKGYQCLDAWPYQLFITLTGPEEVVKKLKMRGLKLNLNLSDISQADLDAIQMSGQADEISFPVPDSWKKILVPQISDTPLEIDDPQAKSLRIDFSRQDFLPIGASLPITIFFPAKFSHTLNPETYTLAQSDFIIKKNGIKMIAPTLYAQGVSRLFLDTVKDMVQVVVIAAPQSERETLLWSAQFLYPHELENRYVAKVLASTPEEAVGIQPLMREEYLRNRFRHYMNRFRFYTADKEKLNLKITLQGNTISVGICERIK